MYKLFLLIIGISTSLLADYMTESDILMEQNLEDIKKKYHIQDEAPQEIEARDISTLKIKEPKKMDTVISPMNQALPQINDTVAPRNEDKLQRIRRELNIRELTSEEKKLDAIRRELDINYEVPTKESRLDKELNGVKKILHMDGEIDGEYSFSNSVRDLKKTLNLDGESSWGIPSFGLPSLFGEEKEKKKDKGLFGINIPGVSIPGLDGVKETGQSLYKGMKYSGQSAEMMSGMMYNSSKMYNTMFGLFDDSPFNIFEEEEEDPSVFDFIEGGNSIMKLFN